MQGNTRDYIPQVYSAYAAPVFRQSFVQPIAQYSCQAMSAARQNSTVREIRCRRSAVEDWKWQYRLEAYSVETSQ